MDTQERVDIDIAIENLFKDDSLKCKLTAYQHYPYPCSWEAVGMMKTHWLPNEVPVCKVVYDAVVEFLAGGFTCGICHEHCITIRPI